MCIKVHFEPDTQETHPTGNSKANDIFIITGFAVSSDMHTSCHKFYSPCPATCTDFLSLIVGFQEFPYSLSPLLISEKWSNRNGDISERTDAPLSPKKLLTCMVFIVS